MLNSKISSYSSAAWLIIDDKSGNNPRILDFLSVNSSFGSIKSDYQEEPDWQTTTHFDFGLSFAVLDKRLYGEFNYFHKLTSFSSDTYSTLSMRNNGVEVTLHSINLNKQVKWNTSVNLTFLKDKIAKLDEGYNADSHMLQEGLSSGVYYLKIYAGVDAANGMDLYYTDNDRKEVTTNPNLAKPQVIGNSNPKFYGGITNSLTYNGFDLSFFWQFVYGNDILDGGLIYLAGSGTRYEQYNKTVEYYNNYWRNPGDITKYSKPTLNTNRRDYGSLYLYDGSYIRLNDLTIGYTLPSNFSSKYKIASARFFARGTNLLTITKYPGWTPRYL